MDPGHGPCRLHYGDKVSLAPARFPEKFEETRVRGVMAEAQRGSAVGYAPGEFAKGALVIAGNLDRFPQILGA